jgi:type I restriction enzyme S subunit
MIVSNVTFFDILANRLDAAFYYNRFNFTSNVYPSFSLSELLYVNPTVKYENLSDNDVISFVPMEVIDEQNGKIAEQRITPISKAKGFTRFKNNDLIWAKITPCMQNGKSAIAKNLINGYGCGSTEFYVLRPKNDKVLIEYIHFILRDKRILESAKNGFGGVAGQQRVSVNYLKSIQIPLPPKEIQQQIVDLYNNAVREKQSKEQEAKTLLDSIDEYLLKELGIELSENVLDERYFEVNIMELIGGRLDPEYYSINNRNKEMAIKQAKYPFQNISDYCTFQAGYAFKSEDYISHSNCMLITIKHISKNTILLNDCTYLPNEYFKQYEKFRIQKDDLLIAMTGATIGKVGIYESNNNALLNQRNGIIRSICLNTFWLMNLLNTELYQSLILRNSVGGAQPNISETNITKLDIPLPSIDIQNQMANNIQSIRAKAKQLQQEATEVLEKAKKEVEGMIIGKQNINN